MASFSYHSNLPNGRELRVRESAGNNDNIRHLGSSNTNKNKIYSIWLQFRLKQLYAIMLSYGDRDTGRQGYEQGTVKQFLAFRLMATKPDVRKFIDWCIITVWTSRKALSDLGTCKRGSPSNFSDSPKVYRTYFSTLCHSTSNFLLFYYSHT